MLNPVEHHVKHHRLWDGSLPRIKECRKCVTAKAKCASKIVYKNRDCADKKALAINIERNWWPGECMKAYRCRYCKLWHLTTATNKRDRGRVEKMRRKWMRKTGQKEKNFNYGWEFPEAG